MLTGTEHFTLEEVQRNTQWPIPAEYQENAQRTLEELERVRAILGVPLRLTSLWRSRASNASLPGSAQNSQHLVANGADFVPVGLTLRETAERWQRAVAAGVVPPFHQFIVEEQGDDGLGAHVHYGRGTGNESLVRLASGAYRFLADWVGSAVASVEAALEGPGALGVALVAGFRGVVTTLGGHGRTWQAARWLTC